MCTGHVITASDERIYVVLIVLIFVVTIVFGVVVPLLLRNRKDFCGDVVIVGIKVYIVF